MGSTLTEEASLRLKVLRFPLIVGVVFIHNYSLTTTLHGSAIGLAHPDGILDFVRNVVSQGLARISVPLFFLMSGYLFFLDFEPTVAGLLTKLKARSRTLLLPFLFWNTATLLVVAAAQSFPASARYLSGKTELVSNLSGVVFLDAIFGVHGKPISYQFWFIRDLMVLVLLTPLVYLLCRRGGLPVLLAGFALWLANGRWFPVPALDATVFFTAGSWLAIKKIDLFCVDRIGLFALMLYIPVLLFDAIWFGDAPNAFVPKVSIVLGVICALWLTRFAIRSDDIKSHLVRLSGASFFVFAAHEPLLTICRKLLYRLMPPHSSLLALGFYFLIPAFVIGVLVALYPRMKLHFPRFMALSCGGR